MGSTAPRKGDTLRRQRREHLSRQITCLWTSEEACTSPHAWDKRVIIFSASRSCQSCNASGMSRSARATGAGGRQGGLHILANCRQSVKRIWEEDDGASLRSKSKQSRPEPKCFKWITPVCRCDYTLLAGTATRWIVFYGFKADLFSFFSPPTWMHFHPSTLAWSECGIVFELPHKQFICYDSRRGLFLFSISVAEKTMFCK